MNGDITLWQGDCLSRMADLPASSVTLVLTDLPYGLTNAPWDTRIDFGALWEQWRRIVKPCGTIALFAQQPFTTDLINSRRPWFKYCWYWMKNTKAGGLYSHSQPMRQIEEIAVFCRPADSTDAESIPEWAECRAYLRGEFARLGLTLKAAMAITGTDMPGHYVQRSQWALPTEEAYARLAAATGGFRRPWTELHDLYTKGNAVIQKARRIYHPPGVTFFATPKPHPKAISALYGNRCKRLGQFSTGHPANVLRYDTVRGTERLHPTQKPVALLEYLIETYTNAGDLVLDCCMGSGSTCVACANTGRRAVGIEMDEHYYNIAVARVAQARAA